jgi:hypothetical protein
MTGAEDFQFSVPLQEQENKQHFSGFAVALKESDRLLKFTHATN